MLIAITREPSPSLARCELSFLAPQSIDVGLARAQHRSHVAALAAAGCEVVTLPAEPEEDDAGRRATLADQYRDAAMSRSNLQAGLRAPRRAR